MHKRSRTPVLAGDTGVTGGSGGTLCEGEAGLYRYRIDRGPRERERGAVSFEECWFEFRFEREGRAAGDGGSNAD